MERGVVVRRLNGLKVGLTGDLIKKKKERGFPAEIANTLGARGGYLITACITLAFSQFARPL